jgi:hypothetical protein
MKGKEEIKGKEAWEGRKNMKGSPLVELVSEVSRGTAPSHYIFRYLKVNSMCERRFVTE